MKRFTATARRKRTKGHSLVETALLMPLLFTILFNGINIAYFWFMLLTLSAVPRLGVQYATQGGQALTSSSNPTTAQVSSLVYENLTGSIGATSTSAQVRVCSSSKGVDSITRVALCDSFGPSIVTFTAPAADPEQPVFVLHRVDVAYQVKPIIPGGAFNVVLPSTLNFHRHVSMRNLY